MKVLKSAKQKNVILDNDFYTYNQLKEMLEARTIFYFNERLEESYDVSLIYWNEYSGMEFRLFLEKVQEIKVVYDKKYEFYTNVAILKDGTKLYIKL